MITALDFRRLRALSHAELLLLVRNPTAMVNAVALPLGMVALFSLVRSPALGSLALTVVTMVACSGLLFVVYYTLVASLVARREELVLKRLKSGESPAWVILLGAALPTIGLLGVQMVLGVVAAAVLMDLPPPANAGLVVLALALAIVAWVLLAVVSSGYTKSVESAQITTLPVLFVPLFFSGIAIPLEVLPDALQNLAQFLPLTPVVELFRLGLVGMTADGQLVNGAAALSAATAPLLVLLGWIAVGIIGSRRVFRWDPRR